MRELVKVLIQRHSMIRRPCLIKVLMVLHRASFSALGRTKDPFWPQNQDFKNIGECWITSSRTVKRNNTGKGGGSGAKVNARESRKGIRVLRTVNVRHHHRVRCCVGTGGLIQPRPSSKYIAALAASCMGAHRMFFSSEALQKAQSRFLERPAAGILRNGGDEAGANLPPPPPHPPPLAPPSFTACCFCRSPPLLTLRKNTTWILEPCN